MLFPNLKALAKFIDAGLLAAKSGQPWCNLATDDEDTIDACTSRVRLGALVVATRELIQINPALATLTPEQFCAAISDYAATCPCPGPCPPNCVGAEAEAYLTVGKLGDGVLLKQLLDALMLILPYILPLIVKPAPAA